MTTLLDPAPAPPAPSAETGPLVLRAFPALTLSDDQFLAFCRQNPDLRIEQSAEGDWIIMPPTGFGTGSRNSEIARQLGQAGRHWRNGGFVHSLRAAQRGQTFARCVLDTQSAAGRAFARAERKVSAPLPGLRGGTALPLGSLERPAGQNAGISCQRRASRLAAGHAGAARVRVPSRQPRRNLGRARRSFGRPRTARLHAGPVAPLEPGFLRFQFATSNADCFRRSFRKRV